MSHLRRFLGTSIFAFIIALISASDSLGETRYTYDDYYVNGCKIVAVHNSHEGSRTLSARMVTVRADYGFENKIVVMDITQGDPNTPYGNFLVSLDRAGEEFSLRDGGREYILTITQEYGEHRVIIKRPGTPGKATEGFVSTSVEELALIRLDQAATGVLVLIGGKVYYALPQGGTRGRILLFRQEDVDSRRENRSPQDVMPAAMADVMEPDENGEGKLISMHPDLGVIDGVRYHLELNNQGVWDVVPGRGD